MPVLADPDNFTPNETWLEGLAALSEGTQTTLGAYYRAWQ